MTFRVGWYVHHHGRGHLARMLSIAPHLDAEIECFSSIPEPADLPAHCVWTTLDRDDDAPEGRTPPQDSDPSADGLLHWAPLGHVGHRRRLATLASALAERPVDVFVVDVSVEVALLVRLLGVRTVVVAQPGERSDPTHQLAYRAATAILAPWPRQLMEPSWLAEASLKTVFTGGISRFESRAAAEGARRRRGVLVLGGRGGASVSEEDIVAAERATAQPWNALGATAASAWTADPWNDLTSARVVISWAGQNAVADIAAADAAAVIVPQDRPFAEQRATARAIENAGLAVVVDRWPHADAWPELLDRAARLAPEWSRWEVAGAAARAAEAITAAAGAR